MSSGVSGIFQRLMELGEEPPAAAPRRLTTSADLTSNASRSELLTQLTQLEAQLGEQKRKYNDLLADATKLRSEYDAYRRTTEREKRQIMDQRAEDKRMLDELRRAGASGKIDETYIKETEAKVTDLQTRLHQALEEVEKTYKRQLEAEHARVAAENAKKEEVQELCQQFELFKETMRQRNERLERELNEAREAAASMKSKTIVTPTTTLNNINNRETKPVLEDASEENSTQDVSNNLESNSDISHLLAQLGAASQREQKLREEFLAEQGRYQRQIEDSKWEIMEAGKKIAELKTDIDTWRSKAAQLESTLEIKEEEHVLKEKDLRHTIRQTEDALTRLQRELQETKQTAESKRQEYEQALMRERETVAKHTVMADEAECLTKTANETLKEQRLHYERLLREREVVLQEQQGICRVLEAALQEEKEDKRQQSDRLEDLRREMNQMQRMISELELMQAQSQRLITLREEEVMSKEEERQKLRGLLREEEEANHRTRQKMMELEARQSETELISAKHAAVTEEAASKLITLEREYASARILVETQQTQLQSKEQTIRQLQVQLDDLIAQSAKFAYYREEQAAKARQFEGRIRELEAERSAAVVQLLQKDNSSFLPDSSIHNSNHNNNNIYSNNINNNNTNNNNNIHNTPSFELLYSAPSERARQQFVSEAVMLARKLRLNASSRLRKLVLISLACILVVIMTASYFIASPSVNTMRTTEAAMELLRQRYDKITGEFQNCQINLKECKQKI